SVAKENRIFMVADRHLVRSMHSDCHPWTGLAWPNTVPPDGHVDPPSVDTCALKMSYSLSALSYRSKLRYKLPAALVSNASLVICEFTLPLYIGWSGMPALAA